VKTTEAAASVASNVATALVMICSKQIAQQKLAFAGHVLIETSGTSTLVINTKRKTHGTKAEGGPRRMWFDDKAVD